jgi:hypothetical protein
MTRRLFPAGILLAFARLQAGSKPVSLRGKLTPAAGKPPRLTLPSGAEVLLEGDDQTTGVLNDERLAGADFEVRGEYTPSGAFRILPIYERALFVHKDAKRLLVTYWCAVCAIRTYTPGICWCCQDETALDLRERLDH